MKRALHFGAGNIGRGFIGKIISEAGYEVIFADVNGQVIDQLNMDKEYEVEGGNILKIPINFFSLCMI